MSTKTGLKKRSPDRSVRAASDKFSQPRSHIWDTNHETISFCGKDQQKIFAQYRDNISRSEYIINDEWLKYFHCMTKRFPFILIAKWQTLWHEVFMVIRFIQDCIVLLYPDADSNLYSAQGHRHVTVVLLVNCPWKPTIVRIFHLTAVVLFPIYEQIYTDLHLYSDRGLSGHFLTEILNNKCMLHSLQNKVIHTVHHQRNTTTVLQNSFHGSAFYVYVLGSKIHEAVIYNTQSGLWWSLSVDMRLQVTYNGKSCFCNGNYWFKGKKWSIWDSIYFPYA